MKTRPQSPTHDAIAARARQLWAEAGRPTGRDEEFWLRAEQQLSSGAVPPPRPSSPPPIPQSPAHDVPPVLREVVQPVARRKAPAPPRKRGSR